jgi:hypothetical protein
MRNLYIFDLDGTLANIEHRRHLVSNGKSDWDAFYRGCVNDKPNVAVTELLNTLYAAGSEIIIFSGRSDLVLPETKAWLKKYTDLPGDLIGYILFMRAHKDFTPDDILKANWYDRYLTEQDKERLVCIFDDRQKVVDMWRAKGLTCLQVAPGNF